ncbi:MAG: leucine-rich repeat domain-containing protein, partial [Planctomycetota bacterium]
MRTVRDICLILLFFILAAGQDCTAQRVEPAVGGKVRTLHFPADQSMGALYIEDGLDTRTYYHSAMGWEYFADARGNVAVPADKRMRLLIKRAGLKDLSGLSALGPNDLYELDISARAQLPDRSGETIMPYVGNLTGLKVLNLTTINITGKGLQSISGLKSLRQLSIESEDLGDADLAQLAELKSLEILRLRADKVTDKGLAHLANLTSLKELNLTSRSIRGAGLAHLAKLPSLSRLMLRGVPHGFGLNKQQRMRIGGNTFGDGAMAYIAKVGSLRELDLLHLKITSRGLAQLSNLSQLEQLAINIDIGERELRCLKMMPLLKNLRLNLEKLSDDAIASLTEFKSLESLELPGSVTDRDMAHLGELGNLKRLYVHTEITDAGLRHLANLESLEELQLYGKGITDEGMSHVSKLNNLKTLTIRNCPVTNAALAKLATLKSLKILALYDTKVTISGLNQLNTLPELIELNAHAIKQDNLSLNIGGLAKLRWLVLRRTTLRDQDLACLANLKRLEWLIINGGITDAGMAHLAGLTNLEDLLLEDSNLTDKGLSYVANMKKLMRLKIGGDFSDKALVHLEGLKGLVSLEITSKNDFSPQ